MLSFSSNNPPDEFHWEGWSLGGSSPFRLGLLRCCWSLLVLGCCCIFSLYFCRLVLSFPLSDSHCSSVVDVVDFVHVHQLNLVIAKKISSSEGQACVCVLLRQNRGNVTTCCTFNFASRMWAWLDVSVVRSSCHWRNHMMHSGSLPLIRWRFSFLISSPRCSLFSSLFTSLMTGCCVIDFSWNWCSQTCSRVPSIFFFQTALLYDALIMFFSNAIITNSCNAPLVPLCITSWLHMHVQLLRLRAYMCFLASGGLSLCSADQRMYVFFKVHSFT